MTIIRNKREETALWKKGRKANNSKKGTLWTQDRAEMRRPCPVQEVGQYQTARQYKIPHGKTQKPQKKFFFE